MQLTATDVVIGISASGSACFVRSALAYAKRCGTRTVLIHEGGALSFSDTLHSCVDFDLLLHSGAELVSGSTRMKAGTATKKALNIISTTAMIRLGKVRDGCMIDLHCCNAKLRHRARAILQRLTNLTPEEAADILEKHDYRLESALGAAKTLNEQRRNSSSR